MKRVLFLYVVLFVAFLGFSQSRVSKFLANTDTIKDATNCMHLLDSLAKKYEKNPRITLEINEKRITRLMQLNQFDEMSKLSIYNINLAKKHHLDSMTAFPHLMIGVSQYYRNKTDDAIRSFKKSIALAKKYKNKRLEARGYNNLGGILTDLKQYDESKVYLLKAINLADEIGDLKIKVLSSRILATYYERLDQKNKALEIYQSLEEDVKRLDDNYIVSSYLVYYGYLLGQLNRPEESLVKIDKAIELLKKIKNDDALQVAYTYKSIELGKLGRFKEQAEILQLKSSLVLKIYRNENIRETNLLETKFKTKEIEQEKKITETELLVEKQSKRLYTIIFLFSLVFIGIVVLVIYYRNQKNKVLLAKKMSDQLLISVVEGEEKERQRIAKDLHDGIVQELGILKRNAEMIQSSESDAALQILIEGLNKATTEIRNLSYQMMPVTLEQLGLESALNDLFARNFNETSIDYSLECRGLTDFKDSTIEVGIFRISQELINNVIKHSRALNVTCLLVKHEQHISFVFEDDGVGFDTIEIIPGIGLKSLKTRVDVLKGNLDIASELNGGTTFFIRIPI